MPCSKEKIKSTETVLEKDLIADILDKGFRKTVLKMLTELKEHVEKLKKTMYQKI